MRTIAFTNQKGNKQEYRDMTPEETNERRVEINRELADLESKRYEMGEAVYNTLRDGLLIMLTVLEDDEKPASSQP
jgi:hypothetical protein